MKYIFVDLEMNPIARRHKEARRLCNNEVIEIGAVVLDEDLRETDCFKQLVKPEYNAEVYKRYAALTGITTGMLATAAHFAEALAAFVQWCAADGEEYLIFAWSDNDLQQLQKETALKRIAMSPELEYMFRQWRDFQKEYCGLLQLDHQISLEKALDSVGITFEGRVHDALWDARNTAELYRLSRDEEEFRRLLKPVEAAGQEAEPATFALSEDMLDKLRALRLA